MFSKRNAFTFNRLKSSAFANLQWRYGWLNVRNALALTRILKTISSPFLNHFPIKTLERITPPVTRESPLFGAVVRISSRHDAVFVFVRFFFTENRPRKASAAAANEDVYEDEFWSFQKLAVADKIIIIEKRLLHTCLHPHASVRDKQQE